MHRKNKVFICKFFRLNSNLSPNKIMPTAQALIWAEFSWPYSNNKNSCGSNSSLPQLQIVHALKISGVVCKKNEIEFYMQLHSKMIDDGFCEFSGSWRSSKIASSVLAFCNCVQHSILDLVGFFIKIQMVKHRYCT